MRIDDYSFGAMTIGGKTYTEDLILLPDRVFEGWWRQEGHNVYPKDLENVLSNSPKTLVLGTGAYGAMTVSAEALRHLRAHGVMLIAEPTGDAVKTFNSMACDDVVGAFHLTC